MKKQSTAMVFVLIVSVFIAQMAWAASYTYRGTLGTTGVSGSDSYHFSNPLGLGVDTAGNVYVADIGNSRVQKYDSTGAFVSTIINEFTSPVDVAVDSAGNMYVLSYSNSCVQKFNSAAVYQGSIGECGVMGFDNYHFFNPYGLTVDSSDNVYVVDSTGNRVMKYNSAGVYQMTIGGSIFESGPDNAHFTGPLDIAVDSDGNIYVADTSNMRVQKFNAAGAYQATIGQTGVPGADNAHFIFPYGVAVDSSDNLYVSDYANARVQIFDSAGVYLNTLGVTQVTGADNSHFNGPQAVTVDLSGNIYVLDNGNSRVQRFSNAAQAPADPLYPEDGLIMTIERYSNFASKPYFTAQRTNQNGVDLALSADGSKTQSSITFAKDVHAICDGEIIKLMSSSTPDLSYVEISHPGCGGYDINAYYGHITPSNELGIGDSVAQGDVIGSVMQYSRTVHSYSPHLSLTLDMQSGRDLSVKHYEMCDYTLNAVSQTFTSLTNCTDSTAGATPAAGRTLLLIGRNGITSVKYTDARWRVYIKSIYINSSALKQLGFVPYFELGAGPGPA